MQHLAFIQQMHQALQENFDNASSWEIRSLQGVSSTNDRASDMLGLYDKVIILSETQSRGRGREQRVWFSPAGGMWLSIGFLTKSKPEELSTPVIDEVHKILSNYISCEIKPPNDILINGKKVCGILVETTVKSNLLRRVIIGIGINVVNEIPEEIASQATRLSDHGVTPNIHDLATEISVAIISRLFHLIEVS